MIAAFVRDYAGALGRTSADARRFLLAAALWAFGRQSVGVLRNLYLKDLGVGEDRIGNVVSASSIGQAAIAIPAIIIMARLGLRRGLVAGAVFESLAILATAASTSFEPILGAAAISGAASALFLVVGQPFLMTASAPAERPYVFSFFFTATVAAGAIGSSAGGALQELFAWLAGDAIAGYRLALAASALASGIGAVAVLGVTRTATVADAGATIFSSLRLKAPGRVALLALPELIIGFGAGMTIPFLQLYFRNEFHQGSFAIGAIYTAGSLGMALGYVVAPAIARRFGARQVIVGSQLLSIVFLVELAFPAGLSFAIASFVLRTSLMNLNAPVHSQYALEMADPADQRAVSSVLSLVRGVTWAIAGSLGGWLIALRGGDFSLTIVATAILYVIAAAVGAQAYAYLERTRPRT